jgi:Transposase
VSKHTIYDWKAKYGGMDVSQTQETKQLRDENTKLRKLVADLSLNKEALQSVIRKNGCLGTFDDPPPFSVISNGSPCFVLDGRKFQPTQIFTLFPMSVTSLPDIDQQARIGRFPISFAEKTRPNFVSRWNSKNL